MLFLTPKETPMLEWLTFVAAAVAAVGAVLAPLISSRASAARQQQDDVDRYVEFAVSPDASVRGLGISHLGFLLKSGKLSDTQANAASAAITAAFRRAEEVVEQHPAAEVAKVGGEVAVGDEVVSKWDDDAESQG